MNTARMNDAEIKRIPAVLERIENETQQIGFTMGSERRTGSLLRTLAATKLLAGFWSLERAPALERRGYWRAWMLTRNSILSIVIRLSWRLPDGTLAMIPASPFIWRMVRSSSQKLAVN